MRPLLECYVCLEPTHEKSPCRCAAPVHRSCLMKTSETFCTICKEAFHDRRCFICFGPAAKHTAGCNCDDLYVHKTCSKAYKNQDLGPCRRCGAHYFQRARISIIDDSSSEDEDEEVADAIRSTTSSRSSLKRCFFFACKHSLLMFTSFAIAMFTAGCCDILTLIISLFIYVAVLMLDACFKRHLIS